MPQRPSLRPEEQYIADLIEQIYDGATASQHDDNSSPGMFDLLVTGTLSAAVEVGLVTDKVIRATLAHWQRHLIEQTTDQLTRTWIFSLSETSVGDRPTSFPQIRPPSTAKLTAVLKRLEERGFTDIGHASEYLEFEPAGMRILDPDIAELFTLLGPAAEDAMSADAAAAGLPGGWTYVFIHGHASTVDPNNLSNTVSELLNGPDYDDLRRKLAAADLPNRIAALVFDSNTDAGWSTSHWEDTLPSVSVELPDEVTRVLITGTNGLVVIFDTDDGWRRHRT